MNSIEISANTDMFYYLTEKPVGDITNSYLVSITNDGEDILAITDLKVCDDPNAALVPLTEEDVRQILIDAGYTDSLPETPEQPAVPFADVAADSFYYDAVAWAVSENITTGITDTHFGPLTFCNRAQAVTFLWCAAGSPEPTSTEHPFADVPADAWFTAPILWAVEQEITTGMGDGTFGVNGSCNRAQIVTFLYRAYN